MYSNISKGKLIEADDRDVLEGVYIVPPKVKEISKGAFSLCSDVEKIVLNKKIKNLSDMAFFNVETIKEVVLPKKLKSIGKYAFAGTKIETIELPKELKEIKEHAFDNCDNLKSIIIPQKVEKLESFAFLNCKQLKSVEFYNEISDLPEGVFEFCSSLENVLLPSNLLRIEDKAFNGCETLKQINIGNEVTYIGKNAFSGCKSLEKINLPDSLNYIGEMAFSECNSLKEITWPGGINITSDKVFIGCTSLETATIGEGVQAIGYHSFEDCSNLKTVKLPNTITDIFSHAFNGCADLSEINLENVISIGYSAFKGCKNLKEINLDNVFEISSRAFDGCIQLSKIDLKNVESIMSLAFKDCYGLEEITFGDNVKYIDSSAFYGCYNLKIVRLSRNNLEQILPMVLEACPTITTIVVDGMAINVTPQFKENIETLYPFLDYALQNNKFIPKNVGVILNTKPEDIPNFYQKAGEWREILNTYLKTQQDNLMTCSQSEVEETISGLYQMCVMLGLFQEGENGKTAKQFILQEVIQMHPDLVRQYGDMNTREYGYNEEYAKFYIKNYRPGINDDECEFLVSPIKDNSGERKINYAPKAYNNWQKVKEAYPNKTVLADRERGSENNNLTEENILYIFKDIKYEHIFEGNEEMAIKVGRYGYTQYEFETLQQWYETSKTVKDNMILKIAEDSETTGITFKVLEKDDIEGLIIGEKTNCCQKVNDAGKYCVEYGMTKPNSCFVKFCLGNRIIAQSWVWYDEKTGVVCLDNIEVPTIWYDYMKKESVEKSFLNCLIRLAKAIKSEMEKNGMTVTAVTIGAGYNDIPGVDKFERIETTKDCLPDDYSDYSDAIEVQYVIPEELISTSKIEDEDII